MAYRVLVVEDHAASRTTLAALLQLSGYDVDTATNGREAVDRLVEHRYDVIVSDLQMPTMDGLELYRQIEHRWPELAGRVVFMTAHRASSGFHSGPKGGPVLAKPFTLERLRQAVAGAIAQAA